jgi:anti-sigma factor RsiW
MNGNCLDIGTIQAFLDCELDHTASAKVSGHIAVCDACANLLGQAEEESAMVFPVLERELNSLVPTQRLWNKINDSIETHRKNRPFWEKALAFISIAFASPSFTAAAGLLIVAGVFAFIWSNRSVPTDVAETRPSVVSAPVVRPDQPAPLAPVDTNDAVKPAAPARSELASYRVERQPLSHSPVISPAARTDRVVATNAVYMPGEESYVKTISSLSKIVDTQKDTAMRPSQRVAYERDMAVVDDAINKLRNEVKKNPKNESAKQVLYASYQNKIDLLNSVSRKEELMASLR